MLRTLRTTGLLTILQSIDIEDENKVGDSKSGGNKRNLSYPSALKKSSGADYLTSGGAKRGNGNTKRGFKAVRGSDYLTPATKKAFNHL